MSNVLRNLERRIHELETQGFILPEYVYRISRPETAKKYTMRFLRTISKFEEEYHTIDKKGKPVIQKRKVSGERGAEIIREKKKSTASLEVEFQMLDSRIKEYFRQFRSSALASLMLEVYEEQKANSVNHSFEIYLVETSSDVIKEVQKSIEIEDSDQESANESLSNWITLLSHGKPNTELMKKYGVIADSEEGGYNV